MRAAEVPPHINLSCVTGKTILFLPSLYRNYMNDSLRSDVFLRFQPESIACACIYLSARLLKIALPKQPAWYLVFGVSEEDIKEICTSILKLYSRKKPDSEKLDKEVEELKKAHQEAKLKAKGLSAANSLGTGSPGFSPNSQPSSPKKSPHDDSKKENGSSAVSPAQMKDKSSNHVNSHKRKSHSNRNASPGVKRSGSSSGGGGGSQSPKRKQKTPPRGYKDSLKTHSRSRSRERDRKESKRHRSSTNRSSHKRKQRSRSRTRNEVRSPHSRHSSKKYYKSSKERSRR